MGPGAVGAAAAVESGPMIDLSGPVPQLGSREGAVLKELARRACRYGTVLMLLLIIVQFALAGAGVFSAMAGNTEGTEALGFHALGALVIALVSLLMVAMALIGRLPWRMTGVAAAFFPLLFLQAILIIPLLEPNNDLAIATRVSDKPWVATLHVLNALFIFWLATEWVEWTRRDLERMRQTGRPAGADLPAAEGVAGSPAQ